MKVAAKQVAVKVCCRRQESRLDSRQWLVCVSREYAMMSTSHWPSGFRFGLVRGVEEGEGVCKSSAER